MKSLVAIGVAAALVLGAAAVRAEESAEGAKPAGEAAEQQRPLADVVFGHISDDHAVEFESPFGGEAKFELPQMKAAFGLPWLDLSITKHLVWLWVAALVVILTFALGRPRSLTPKGFGVALETLVLFVRDEVAKPSIGEKEYKRYTPYLLSCFFFILVCNLLGAIPYTATPTGNIMVTAALAICTFVVTQYAAIRAAGLWGFIKHLTGGVHWLMWPIMIPIEVMGLFAKPFALCLRLFANMIAGHIVIFYLLGLIFIFKTVLVAPVSLALAVAIYMLEIFVAFLQAYIFTVLSSVFIGLGVAMGHHEEHAAHDDHGHAAKAAH